MCNFSLEKNNDRLKKKPMVEQSVEHFTRLTAKYCLKTWQEQHEDGRHLLFGVYLQN